jgi:DnaJ-class molecular chaperone
MNKVKKVCPECEGTGEITEYNEDTGKYDKEECPTCNGKGVVK